MKTAIKIRLVNLLDRYKRLSQPVKASFWFIVCSILQKGISLISTPIFTRLLTKEQYGVYTVYQSWYSIIAIFATLSLNCGYFVNGLTKYSDRKNEFVSSMQGLATTATILVFAVYCLCPSFWNRQLKMDTLFVLLVFVELLFVPAYQFWMVEQRYEYRYRGLIAVTLFIACASPLIGVVTVLNTEYKAEARVLSYVLVQVAVGLVFYIRNMWRGRRPFNGEYWRYALRFSIPLIPHYLSQIVLQQSDRIMINDMVGTGEAAVYGVAYTLSTLMIIVTNAVEASFTPYCYKSLKAKKYDGIRSNAAGLIVFVAACCLGVSLLGPELIAILASAEYAEAVWIIPPVSASVYFMFLYNVFGVMQFYYEYTQFAMVASCVAAAMNVGLNYVFIAKYGYIAAGYTTLVCYLVFAIAHIVVSTWIARKKTNGMGMCDLKLCVIVTAVLLAVTLACNVLYQLPVVRYGLIAFALVGLVLFRKKLIRFAQRFLEARKQ